MCNRWLTTLVFSIGFVLALTSCVNTKKATYFNDIADTAMIAATNIPEPVINPNDLLSISVSSLDPQSTAIFNTPNLPVSPNAGGANNTLQQAVGYLVNREGIVKFPILGNIKAAGLTKKELENTITSQLTDKKLLFDPIVNVRFLNYRVTVLGEVARPGVINVPSEQISILEAIGQAGDLTIYGKRENVALIRQEENGNRTVHRLDLNSSKVLSSPYFFLKSNDVVYVEPGKARAATASRGQQLLPSILSGVSILVVIITSIIK
ncbi:polysaccharide biosynthesis/export family protein [Flavisolibacter ginsengisoli]|jgi:polysaccharide export outer membrane protein|uniref:Polysaccharide export outer membrane protein n=1 Tax=Flavisolibacter ginsengisoli DSM 18119 TaxID=1121884 RepID=A0A1M5E1K0_9BACT|nr:polysaccharide biosynthesis/export family protein [Flavisolibacter ginsengisoli]SHF72941.1 polysaccharide export outer membrane protein [Flavisolibacter ginsengisoli DSM 18119]